MAYLKKLGVQFVACDNPHANELTIDILVAVAADEGRRISLRTRDALKAYREGRRVSKRIRAMHPDGVPAEVVAATAGKLGASLPQCRNLTDEARARGARAAGAAHRRRAGEAYGHLVPTHARAPGRWAIARRHRGRPQRRGTRHPTRQALEQNPGQAGVGSVPARLKGRECRDTTRRYVEPGQDKLAAAVELSGGRGGVSDGKCIRQRALSDANLIACLKIANYWFQVNHMPFIFGSICTVCN